MKNRSIKTSILLPTLALLVAGIAVMVIIIGVISSSTTNDLSDRIVSARVNEYANKFEAMCMEYYGTAVSLAPIIRNLGESSGNPRQEAISTLTSVLESNEDLVSIWTVWEPNAFDGMDSAYVNTLNHDRTGRFIPYLCKEGNSYIIEAIPDYETGDFYLGAKNSGKPYITDPYECEFNGKMVPVFTITIPVMKNGVFAGAVGIDINLSHVNEVMNAGTILDEGYLYVRSPGGLIATHKNSDLIFQGYEATWIRDYQTEMNSILKNGGDFAVNTYSDQANENIRFLASGVMIGDTERYWAVCGIVPERVITASSTRLVLNVVLIGVALIALVGLTVLFIVRNRLKGLPVITKAAEAMAHGEINLSGLDSGTGETKNEIALLGRAFFSMAEGVKGQSDVMSQIADGDYSMTVPVRSEADIMNKAINNMLDNTNTVMGEIQASSEQVATGSKQIAAGAQSLAQGSTEQASAIEELSASINDIAEQTAHNAHIAREASELSDQIKGSAETGNQQMGQMMQAVRDINEASSQIEKIIKVIDDIAFQTNILALNAAVEAARAGQYGKGFAVVAEEVGNLAAKSAQAAKETGGLIENSVEKANFGLNIATETASSLGEIVEGIKQAAEIVTKIANSSDEQAAAISQINTGIDQVAQVVQQNSATAEESAAASQEMSGQSDMLTQLISQFKLKETGFNRSSAYLAEAHKDVFNMKSNFGLDSNFNGDFGKY